MNQNHCEQILNRVVDGFWSWDVKADKAFLNPRYCELLGYAPDEVVFNSSMFLKLIHPDDADAMTAILREYLEGLRDESLAEFRMIRKDGTVIWVRERASVVARDAAGQPLHMVGSIIDITDYKLAELELKERHDLLGNLTEQLERQVEERTALLTAANEQLSREVEERRQSEADLLDYQRRLEELGLEISITEEQVRCRIASELHDQVGQCLMLGKIKVESLADSDLSPEQLTTVKTLERLLEKTIHDIRSLTFQLRPPILVQAGLEAAVRWLADEFKEQHGLSVEFIDDRQPKPLADELRTYLFQAVRELLLNVAKHAGTSRACVTMQKGDDTLTIKVEDAGNGFDPTAAIMRRPRSGGFGLFNVQQRTQFFGGNFTIESSPGCGCKATIVAPLAVETELKVKP